jgi:hypothetical protein
LVVDARRAAKVAAGEAHVAHAINDGAGIEAREVDMLNGFAKQFGFGVGFVFGFCGGHGGLL